MVIGVWCLVRVVCCCYGWLCSFLFVVWYSAFGDLFVVCCVMCVVCCLLLVACCSLFVVCRLLFVVCSAWLVVRCSSFVLWCLVLVVWCLFACCLLRVT